MENESQKGRISLNSVQKTNEEKNVFDRMSDVLLPGPDNDLFLLFEQLNKGKGGSVVCSANFVVEYDLS